MNAISNNKRLLSLQEAAEYLSISEKSAQRFLDSIGARVNICKRVTYDKQTIDTAIDSAKEIKT